MDKNTKHLLGGDNKRRLYKEMEDKFVHEVEMPELERRKIELGKLSDY